MMRALLLPALACLASCAVEPVKAAVDDTEPTCEEIRQRYARYTVHHRDMVARGYLYSARQTYIERAQVAAQHMECFFETDLGELR